MEWTQPNLLSDCLFVFTGLKITPSQNLPINGQQQQHSFITTRILFKATVVLMGSCINRSWKYKWSILSRNNYVRRLVSNLERIYFRLNTFWSNLHEKSQCVGRTRMVIYVSMTKSLHRPVQCSALYYALLLFVPTVKIHSYNTRASVSKNFYIQKSNAEAKRTKCFPRISQNCGIRYQRS